MVFLPTFAGHKAIRYVLIAGLIVLVVVVAAAVVIQRHWPFTEAEVRSDLGSATSSQVRFGNFRTRYFPPGCVAENVVFQQNPGTPLMEVRRLTVETSFTGLLRHHVSLLRAEGLHGVLEFKGFRKNGSGNNAIIDKVVADDAILDIPRKSPQEKAQFVFHKFLMTNLNGGGVVTFDALFENPLPRGMLQASGQFGPWNEGDPSATPVQAKYSLEKADLGVFHSIGGDLSSTGAWQGSFKQMRVEGSTHSPEFVVSKTGHGLPLDTDFQAEVDATNGDVIIRTIKARFGKDEIAGSGSIARRDDGKRSAVVDLTCNKGRIEDTFHPFIHSPRSPLTGDVAFQMHVVIPSGHEAFLRKLELTSTFKIQNAQFTKPETQARLSKISASPGEQQAHGLADFEGNVSLRGGVAKFSNLSVHDDGAAAFFRGDYDLTDQKVNLHGRLKTEASLAKTTQGIKSVFAKAIEPFFKKRPHETVVPVHIGGTFSRPSFGLDVGG
jgi:hypothetical protein